MRQLATMIGQDGSKTELMLLATTILKIMNEACECKKFIRDILLAIKQATGFEAVGIRLKEGDDYPYYDAVGFPDRFINAEGYVERILCARDSSGTLLRNTSGKVCLECMCGNILSGRSDSRFPFFTKGGSFWSNNMTELFASSIEADLRVKNRNQCRDEGYESVALIPLRFGDQIIGLLQLNDHRIGSLTLETIEFLEVLGNSIGIAVDRRRMEEQAPESEKIYHAIFENTSAATAEEKYRMLVETLNDVIFTLDIQGIIVYINPVVEQILGYAVSEVVGQPFSRFIYPVDLPGVFASFEHSIEGKFEPFEFRVLNKANQIRYVRTSSRLLMKDDLKMGLTGILTDITERILAEEALKKSEERLNLTLDAVNDGIWDWDLQTGNAVFSRRYFTMLGYEPYEIPQNYESWKHLVHSEDIEEAEQNINESIHNGRGYAIEIRMRTKSGGWRWILSRGMMVERDAEGHPVRMVGTHSDITERKQVEEELQNSRSLMLAITEGTTDAIYAKDIQGRYLIANSSVARFVGKSQAEIIGQDDRALFSEADADQIMAGDRLVMNKGQTLTYEEFLTLADGLHTFLAIKGPMRDASGEVIGLFGVARDITDRKRYEEMLLKAKEAAEDATRAKSEFLANMSHEIRTPMNAVIGTTCLLQGESLTPEQREYAEIIRSSGEALLSIINDILDLSKSDGGMMELERQPFNLQHRIEATFAFVSARASEKGLKMEYTIEDDVPSVILGDPTRLGQILTNLLNNAVKFTERGKVTISVSGRKQEDGIYEIHFAVEDTGIGIPEDKIERLFQPFSQVDASTTRKYGGTGLGLAISKRLVNLMGGKMWVESIVGIGSTFHFTIMAESNTDVLVDNFESVSGEDLSHADIDRTLRILLAEDNVVNQKVTQKMLSKLGYRATVVANGIEVLQALENQHFDVILMDVQMPEIDGLEATRAIRQRWKDGRPKIIAMTASALKGDREMCLAAGMDDYISKPVRMEELARKLSHYRSSVDNS